VTHFHDLARYVAIPRLTGLRLAPDGTWLAASVQQPDPEGKKFSSAIWRIPADPGPDAAAPVRLTQSAPGEESPVFLPDGSLLFVSRRPDPAAGTAGKNGDDPKPALWLLPAGGGEARRIAAPPGGVSQVATAHGAPGLVFMAPTLAGATGPEEDAGPPRDLTPQPGRALDEQSADLAPDGSAAVTGWVVCDSPGHMREELAVIDTATGGRRVLLATPDRDFAEPHISPDGRLVVCTAVTHDSYDRPGEATLLVVPLAGGEAIDLMAGMDRRPSEAAWAADSAAVYFTADDRGRCPVFRAGLAGQPVTQVTSDDAAYSNLCLSPDGRYLYALRSAVDSPPAPVRLDLSLAGPPQFLPSPAGTSDLPGHLTEVMATADDGVLIRGWLALPAGASGERPAPLLLWVHGGPRMSWNAWSWRWNPWLMVAQGYAVLLPDPGLSSGYGQDFVARGHADWGERPFADLMAITDAAVARPDIDAERTAAMGGSYGGYMANWIAGHTDRFRAIVSHAGLWALDQMFGTTDMPAYWRRHFGDPITHPDRYRATSPHYHLAAIRTPMLIIHGDKDYRVPVGEALRLWAELTGRPDGSPDVKFLYFPTENHWILAPGHTVVWYQAVLAFLATHLLGEPWQRPDLL